MIVDRIFCLQFVIFREDAEHGFYVEALLAIQIVFRDLAYQTGQCNNADQDISAAVDYLKTLV